MKTYFLFAVVAFSGSLAQAQSVSGGFFASHDSDGFRESKQTLGYAGTSGWGLRAGPLRYTAPGWSASGSVLAGTYKSTNDNRTIDANLGAARVSDTSYLVGGLDYMQRLSASTSAGLSVERDFVNSIRGIENGTHFTALALVLDHAFSERFNVGVAAGSAHFSNDNDRPILRTRWNYSLDERYGLNAYVKTRNYRNTNAYRAEYFSPERLSEISLGLSARFEVAQAFVLSASVDTGQQRIDGGSEPIWQGSVGFASRRRNAVQWFVGLEASNTAPLFAGQTGGYRYTSATARVNIPF
ncbi:MAG: hypothetical protein KKB08_01155 [Gammaproteobacteria bacterium]|jgi:hypothetical protein|nr:hypothetical protein [Gammaproteobacteria bacterium]MBU0826374.1 hypothetical protein [Gammaproteobacteria bacterium]MBU1815353.1 hypothetical protein [Gammaproteobacteria bacterium]